MKTSYIIPVAFGLLSAIYSCNSNAPDNQLIPELQFTISLSDALDDVSENNDQSVLLSEIGGNISYVPFELNQNSAFSSINRISIADSSIIIDDYSRVLEFRRSGRFVGPIGRAGKGPGEYAHCSGVAASDTLRCVRSRSMCYLYHLSGAFIQSFSLNPSFDVDKMLFMEHRLMVFNCYNYSESESRNPYSLYITDLSGNLVKTYMNHHKRRSTSDAPFYSILYPFQDKIRFKEWGCDTLYTVTDRALIPYAIFNLGKHAIPYDLTMNDQNYRDILIKHANQAALTNILEDQTHFYFSINFSRETDFLAYGLYSKYTGTVKIINETGFQNDLDGGLPFVPKYVSADNTLVDWVEAYDLREKVLNADAAKMRRCYGQKFDDLLNLAQSLSDDSGKVLVLVKP